jgi:hypothetical protein
MQWQIFPPQSMWISGVIQPQFRTAEKRDKPCKLLSVSQYPVTFVAHFMLLRHIRRTICVR